MVFGILELLGQNALDPFVILWNSLVENLPGIIAAILLLIFGYIVSSFIGLITKWIIKKTRIDDWLEKTGRSDAIGNMHVSEITGKLVKWWVFILFLTPAANVVQLEQLASIFTSIFLWAPHLIAGIIIMIAGLIFADFLADSVTETKKFKSISVLIRIVTIIFFAEIALREIGINLVLAETTLLMLIGGIILILVIGFGVGLIKPAEETIRDWKKKLK